jgi:hypothetical protein
MTSNQIVAKVKQFYSKKIIALHCAELVCILAILSKLQQRIAVVFLCSTNNLFKLVADQNF